MTLFDHVLEEHGFGRDHWHSLLWNLHNVKPDEWERTPPGGGRTIRELALHIGNGFLAYDNVAFGDGSRAWGDRDIDGVAPGTTPEEVTHWLSLAHTRLRSSIAGLTDDQLSELRNAPWGEPYETRRLIELQIQHALYHTGEINHLRALLQHNDVWNLDDIGREK